MHFIFTSVISFHVRMPKMRILIQRTVYVVVVLHFIMAYLKAFMASLHFLL